MYDCGVLHFISSSTMRYDAHSCPLTHTHDVHTSFILVYVPTISHCVFIHLLFNLPQTILQGLSLCKSFFTSSTSSMKEICILYTKKQTF